MSRIKSMLKDAIPASVIRQKLALQGSVLFTFDDGPHPEITPRVLDALDRHGAKALFFIPGNRIARAPGLIRAIVERGHGVGNHSRTHADCSRLSIREAVSEINGCRDELLRHGGVTTRLFRPPMGYVSPSLLLAALKCRHDIVRWSLDTGEYSYMRGAPLARLAENFLGKIHDRAIVLSHDDHETIPCFLELVLPRLVEEGIDLKRGLSSLTDLQS